MTAPYLDFENLQKRTKLSLSNKKKPHHFNERGVTD